MKTPKATFLRAGALLAVAVTGGNLAQTQACSVSWTGNADNGARITAGNWSTHKVPGRALSRPLGLVPLDFSGKTRNSCFPNWFTGV